MYVHVEIRQPPVFSSTQSRATTGGATTTTTTLGRNQGTTGSDELVQDIIRCKQLQEDISYYTDLVKMFNCTTIFNRDKQKDHPLFQLTIQIRSQTSKRLHDHVELLIQSERGTLYT